MSVVCEVLTKISRGATLEDKRRERKILFNKKHIDNIRGNKKYKSCIMKEIGMTFNIMQELEYQKSNYLLVLKI